MISVHTPAPVSEPRGARLAVAAVMAWVDTLRALRKALGASVEKHRRIREANALRAMALQMGRRDPGFAADLRAAADRHEWL